MAKQTYSWGDIPEPSTPGSGKGKNSDLYMKLEPGEKYRIRIYGNPVIRNFAWYNGVKYNVPNDLCEDFERHTGEKPRVYIITNIIDRNDTKNGKVRFKLLEKGTSVFATMKTYQEETGISPGGDRAPDFLIKAVPGKERRNTKYEVMNFPGEAPFSEKEKELIDRPNKMSADELKKLPIGERGPIDLEAFYDMEKGRKKVMDLLDGKEDDGEDVTELTDEVADCDDSEEETKTKKTINTTKTIKTTKTTKTTELSDDDDEENLDDLIEQFE
jgi:hypothetical protein